ncbi:MAG: hypothetical protein N2511_00235 [Thermodesulfovibrionales bacterium]|nr:hypothetical protein [Thermodesulfovibrionales bacterium]
MQIFLKIQQFQSWFQKLDKKEFLKKHSLLILLVILPVLLLTFYYLFIASDKFLSESKVTIKQTGQQPAALNFGIFSLGSPIVREDAMYLQEYILSYDMLNHLDKKLNLKKIYQDKRIDFFQRLSQNATQENFLKYYQRHIINVIFDDVSSILTIKVYAFNPEDAKKINEAILEQCERYINGVSHKIAKEQMNFIEQELSYANQKMQTAKNTLIKFQNTHKVIDPSQEAQATASLISQLEVQLATQEAQLKNLLTYLSEDSFQVQALKNQIKALKEQIEGVKSKIIGGDETKLNRVAAEYLNFKLDVDFSTDIYKATLTALELTRVEASRKIKNLVIIASPNLPDEALYPKKTYNLALTSLLLLILYGILKIIIGVIKEHRL